MNDSGTCLRKDSKELLAACSEAMNDGSANLFRFFRTSREKLLRRAYGLSLDNQYEESLKICEKALSRNQYDTDFLVLKGDNLGCLASSAAHPETGFACLVSSQSAFVAGKLALEAFNSALELESADPDSLMSRANLHFMLGHLMEARQDVREAVRCAIKCGSPNLPAALQMQDEVERLVQNVQEAPTNRSSETPPLH